MTQEFGAITSLKRSQVLPDVPALSESMPGFEVGAWYGVMAPANTPQEIVRRLNAEITKALQTQEARARFAQQGAELMPMTQAEYRDYLKSELSRWTRLAQSAGPANR